MNKYTIFNIPNGEVVKRLNDDGSSTFIPLDPANSDYQAYLAWVAEGNTAEEWSPDATI